MENLWQVYLYLQNWSDVLFLAEIWLGSTLNRILKFISDVYLPPMFYASEFDMNRPLEE